MSEELEIRLNRIKRRKRQVRNSRERKLTVEQAIESFSNLSDNQVRSFKKSRCPHGHYLGTMSKCEPEKCNIT